MTPLPSWEESRLAVEQRMDSIDDRLKSIESGIWKLVWVVVGSVLATIGHAVLTFLQMHGR